MPRPALTKKESVRLKNAKSTPKKNKLKGLKKSLTKSELLSYLAENHELTKMKVAAILEDLLYVVTEHMAADLPMTLPRICKFKPKHKPATKARKGVNPFTGEPMTIKAKPACTTVKILALKDLKAATGK